MPRAHQSHKTHIPPAKLNPPRLPAIIGRPRLYRLLDGARKHPVSWINASPGFGKTTLVAGYLRARKIHSIWYQVDEGDSDLATFFHYLTLAAKQAAPQYCTPLPHLTPEYLQGLPTFTRRFFESLYAQLKPPALLILDNYQDAPLDSLFHETVALGIEALPERMNVIVMSRTLPPPPFARMQAAQHISFLGDKDLRLTKAESRSIVRLHTGLHKQPRPVQIEALHDKLQGWVAGLVLQLEQMKMDKHRDAILPGETPQIIFDYLAREVMQRLSPETQEFLMRTAFLPDMTAAMAEKLTGNALADDILLGLYQSRHFTERRAGTEYIYQYHPLFRGFLRDRAHATLRHDEVTEIQNTAAALLEHSDRVEDAVALYTEAGQVGEIIRIILTGAAELLQHGRSQMLERWLAHVPDVCYEQEPWLFYWLGSCRLVSAPLESEGIFERAFERFRARDEKAGMLLSWAGIISSIQFSWIDISRFDRWIDTMLSLVRPDASLPSREIDIPFTFCMINALMWRRPDTSTVTPWIVRAKNLLEEVLDIEKYSPFVAQMSNFCSWLGDLEAAGKYSKPLKAAAEAEANSPLMRLIYYGSSGPLRWLSGEAKEALHVTEQGLRISEKTGIHVFDTPLLAGGFYASLFLNDVASAEQYLERSASLVNHPAHIMRANFLLMRAWVTRIKENLSEAWKLIQEGLAVKGLKGSAFHEALLTYAAAELLHGLGEQEQATRYLNSVKVIADYMGSLQLRFMGDLLESQFAVDQGREEVGLAALRRALALGREQGYSFVPWWIPKVMARLCAKALDVNIEVDYVRSLIRKTRLVPDGSVSISEAWPWPVKIYTLGRFEIHLDGKPLPPRRKAPYRVLNLLKAIIAMGGRDIPASRLIDSLWVEAEGDTGEETLHKTLQRLRHLLSHDGLIQVRESKVSLNRQICWVDAMAFQTLLESSGDAQHQQPHAVSRFQQYEKAIALYRGPFLDEDGSHDWADHRRERLRYQFEQAVQHVSEWKKTEGQESAAVICLENGLEADPLAEPLYPCLIRFLCNLERQDDAKQVLARYHMAVAMAGREPSADMQRLAKNLSAS